MTIGVVKRWMGMQGGLCDQVRIAARELSHTARVLHDTVRLHERARDPFQSILSTTWNNHEFDKFTDHAVDTGTKAGVQASSIKTAHGSTR